MSFTLATGSTLSVASTYGVAKVFSSISNATEAIASFVVDPALIVGDVFEVTTSGWQKLVNRVLRVKAISGVGPYLVTLEGVNTIDTARYPAGAGAGTVRKITAWTQIQQLKDINVTPGAIKWADISTFDDTTDRQMPAGNSPTTMDLEVFDDPTLAYYPIVVALSDANTPAGMKINFPTGSVSYGNGYWSINKVPTMAKGAALTCKLNASYNSDPIRYAS